MIHAISPENFKEICEMGAEVAIMVAERLESLGIDPGQTGSVLIVALGGVMKGGDMTHEDIKEGIEIAQKLWILDADGGATLRDMRSTDDSIRPLD